MRSYLELIEHWEQFLEEQPKGSLEDFAQWILERPTRASQAMAEDAAAVYEVSAAQVEKSYTIANAKAPYLLWRMSKILKVYNKPAFELEGLKSQDEFAILSYVQLVDQTLGQTGFSHQSGRPRRPPRAAGSIVRSGQ